MPKVIPHPTPAAESNTPVGRSAVLRAYAVGALVLFAMAASLAFRPAAALPHRPLSEDGYYLLSVSRNVALGHGVTIDGIHATNGFQPLFAFLNVPAYWLTSGDRVGALRIVLLLEAIWYAVAAWLFALIARDCVRTQYRGLAFWIALLGYPAASFLYWQHFNGLETGIQLPAYLLVARCYQRLGAGSIGGALATGSALGLLVLARIDAVFFVALFCAALLVTPWAGLRIASRIRRATLVGVTSVLVSSPWWLYNYLGFGALMPSSGSAQQKWGFYPERLRAAVHALGICLNPIGYAAGGDRPSILALNITAGAAALAVLWYFGRGVMVGGKSKIGDDVSARVDEDRRERLWQITRVFLLTYGVLVAWYVASSFASHFYRRYFAPLAMPMVFLITFALVGLCVKRSRLGGIAALCLCLPVAAITAQLWRSGQGQSWFLRDQVGLVDEQVPKGASVGAYQSGTLGYFRDGVLNLDGKVNAEALLHQGDMAAYLRGKRVEWFCDWHGYVVRAFGDDPSRFGWTFVTERGGFELYHYTRSQ